MAGKFNFLKTSKAIRNEAKVKALTNDLENANTDKGTLIEAWKQDKLSHEATYNLAVSKNSSLLTM